ncbi:hypothetical protein PV327_010539 [Microctonus hyperodae]|uniref:Laccase n=1 Tax=Microctonus hyperodae TaxID=165561 RepID=A0AA39FS40_MICHY|nr:hypothetical protein PV327_010539 [Microctonus hyperodae]
MLSKEESNQSLFFNNDSHCVGESNRDMKAIKLSTPEECIRPCLSNETAKICHYNFTLEFYPAVGTACNLCTPTITQGLKNYPICECILIDGYERTVFSVNRIIPGPQIQVCKNDYIVVDVKNQADGTEVSIHWHGLFQKNSQYYDGVPFVTQCPIGSFSTFRYQFKAAQSGTYFWHSHVSVHRLDGQYGPLIIREPNEDNPHADLYDVDDPTHVIIISDWMHELATDLYPGLSTRNEGQKPDNVLINGFDNGSKTAIELATFNVQPGMRYRFRLINGFTTVCLSGFNIQNHSLLLIAQDGANIQPIYVDTIITGAGERMDFVLETNMTASSYWIHVKGVGTCSDESIQQLAILKYETTSENEINDTPTYLNDTSHEIIYNPIDGVCDPESGSICPSNTKTVGPFDDNILKNKPDLRFILSFGFHHYASTDTLDDLFSANQSIYPIFMVAAKGSDVTSLIDSVSNIPASAPPLSESEGWEKFCEGKDSDYCKRNVGTLPCACTHVRHIPLNSLVEVVIYDEFSMDYLIHPFHLHGTNFHVFDMGRVSENRNITLQDIELVIEMHEKRLEENMYDKPGQKDTILIPLNGWAIGFFIVTLIGIQPRNLKYNFKDIELSSPEECLRPCGLNEPSKICYYTFTLEFYPALGVPCANCTPSIHQGLNNYPSCECILLDGFERTVFSVNRMIPGPQIQVCKNDYIVVDVKNEADGAEVSIHWHGLFQKNSQYYDGVPFVTQCPIGSFSTFRYQFKAAQSGTYFWHSHVAMHRLDGQYGPLIIREPDEDNPHADLYDVDDPTHVILISDWMHQLSTERFPGLLTRLRSQSAQNILINGVGKFTFDNGTESNVELATFNVQPGMRYRFRFINSFTTVCLAQFSIEDHVLQLIAQDGANNEPVYVNTIITGSGERVDFILNANLTNKSYWIQVRGLGECGVKSIQQLAILKYENSSVEETMTEAPTYQNGLPLGILYNPLDASCNIELGTVCPSNTKTVDSIDEKIMKIKPDVQLVLSFDFHDYKATDTVKDLFSAKHSMYPVFLVAVDQSTLVGLMDDVVFKSASAPPLTDAEGRENFCTGSNSKFCKRNPGPLPCTCTNFRHIPLNSLVEVVIYDKRLLDWLIHPFHLHGTNFHVFDMGRFSDNRNISKQDIDSVIMKHKKRLKNNMYDKPGEKDSILVPQGGWVIFRYIASNPGYWLFHCHFDYHSVVGMQMLFHVGEQSDLPPVPPGFPTCGSFKPPVCVH